MAGSQLITVSMASGLDVKASVKIRQFKDRNAQKGRWRVVGIDGSLDLWLAHKLG